jgi:hypothetical protein
MIMLTPWAAYIIMWGLGAGGVGLLVGIAIVLFGGGWR